MSVLKCSIEYHHPHSTTLISLDPIPVIKNHFPTGENLLAKNIFHRIFRNPGGMKIYIPLVN